ncbi:hypothetical protein [Pontibacter chitinilyticus]|uniref:hypothetical protein n=1 Tax=Pontibacter chitinilyticus TaxID=2674989 RepID=UPI00321B9D19
MFSGLHPSNWEGNGSEDQMVLFYKRELPKDLLYLLSFHSGKYIFTDVTSSDTTVDFSAATPTEQRTYAKPAGTSGFNYTLFGTSVEGDYSQKIYLYHSGAVSHKYDLLFPPTRIKEYDLSVRYADADGIQYEYFHLGPTVPEELGLAGSPGFAVMQADSSGFKVSYSGEKPVASQLALIGRRGMNPVFWSVYLPAEQTSFDPGPFLENLQAKNFQGTSVSIMKVDYLQTYYMEGYSYQSLLDYWHNQERTLKRELKQYHLIRKKF